jgi:hypothetical protein
VKRGLGEEDDQITLQRNKRLQVSYNRWLAVRVKLLSLAACRWLAGYLEPPNQRPALLGSKPLGGCANFTRHVSSSAGEVFCKVGACVVMG